MKTLLISLALITRSASMAMASDLDHPTPLPTNVVEGKASGRTSTTTYYSFTAGPGDLTLTVDGTTNYYSTFFDIELLSASDFQSLGAFAAPAADSSKRTLQTIPVAGARPVILKISTRQDNSVLWLQYKVSLSGAVDLAAPSAAVAPSPSPLPVEVPVAISGAVPCAAPPAAPDTPIPEPPPVPALPGGKISNGLLDRLLGALPVAPSTGTMSIEMKDGTVQQIDLTAVKRIAFQKTK
jgi:hypothetical protein